MFDYPIKVLDSHLRFTNLVHTAQALNAIATTRVDPVIAERGDLVAGFWRCGWDLEGGREREPFRLQYTKSPLASWELSYEALRAIAPYVHKGSFVLFAGDHRSVQQVRFLNGEVAFERGRLAFVPRDPASEFQRGGHVVIGIDDSDLAPVHAAWLASDMVPLLRDLRIDHFEVRAELDTRTGRHVAGSGPQTGGKR